MIESGEGTGFTDTSRRVAEWIASYRARLPGLPVLARVRPGDVAAALPLAPPEEPEDVEAVSYTHLTLPTNREV